MPKINHGLSWLLIPCLLSVAQAQDTYQFERTSPSKVMVMRNGRSTISDGTGLKIEVVPNNNPSAISNAIPMREDSFQPVLMPDQYQPVTRKSFTPNPGEYKPALQTVDSEPYNFGKAVPLNDSERQELDMWRRLANAPIEVTIKDNKAIIEWSGATSEITIPPHGNFQIKLSPSAN
jgi:hypothetical protein